MVKALDNEINICQAVDGNGNPTSYQRMPIKLVSASSDNRFLKFRLVPRENQKYFQEIIREGIVNRYYGVTSVYLNHGTVKSYSNAFGYIFVAKEK